MKRARLKKVYELSSCIVVRNDGGGGVIVEQDDDERDVPLWMCFIIPLISAAVGYATNVIALRMSFYPIEFTGVKVSWFGREEWFWIVTCSYGNRLVSHLDSLDGKELCQRERESWRHV